SVVFLEWIMSIKFVCSCGKHLRARDEMAARRSVCPRCGSPVGIPSKQPASTAIAAKPVTPAERLKGRVQAPVIGPLPDDAFAATAWDPPPRASAVITPDKGVSVPKPLDPSQVTKPAPPAPRRRRHRGWELETQWQECLGYPFAGYP